MSSRSAQSLPPKRRRPALSCEQCRRRKVRCDRSMPCGPCRRTRPSLACSYVHEGKAALDAGLDTSAVARDASELQVPGSLAQLEQSVRMLQERVESLEKRIPIKQKHDDRPMAYDVSGIPRSVNELDDRVKELERQFPTSRPDRRQYHQINIPPLFPFLKRTGDRVELFGPTHWAHVFQQFHYLRDLRRCAIHAENELQDPAPGLLNDLPVKDICDQLVHCYLRTMEGIFRVLHIPSFYEDYAKFWEDTKSVPTTFVLKLLLVLGIGSVFHSQPGPVNDLRLPIRRWVHAAQWWLTGPTTKETRNLEALQVHCLLLLCRHAYAIDKQATWNPAGSLLRLAVSQGLHRDPKYFPSLSPFEGEMRRRIWATVIELNLQFSNDVSMPPLLALHDFDTKPPSNANDEDFDKSSKSLPVPSPTDTYTSSALQIALLSSFSTRLHISQTLHDYNHELSYEAALDCGTQVCTASNALAGLFRGYFAQTASSDSGPTLFHHRLLNTILHRTLLNIYRPFTLEAIHSPLFHLARKLSLDSALAITSYAESSPNCPYMSSQQSAKDFHRLCLSGGGSFRGPFSQEVIVMIGLELMLQTEEIKAQQPTGSTENVSGAIDQTAPYTRAPMMQALQSIHCILGQCISVGIPMMKRYSLISGILAQAQLAHGVSEEQAVVREALLESMQSCRFSLQEVIAREKNDFRTGSTLAHEETNRSNDDDAMASKFSPDFWASEMDFDSFSFWEFPPASPPTPLD